MYTVLQYIHEHIEDKLSLHVLSETFGYSDGIFVVVFMKKCIFPSQNISAADGSSFPHRHLPKEKK